MDRIKIRNAISMLVIMIMIASVFALPAIDDSFAVNASAKKVKVTFYANGGKFVAKKYQKKKSYSKKITRGKKIGKLPKVKRTGYTLKGWYTKKTGGKKVTKNTRIKKKTKIYARWTAKSYDVTFIPQNGEASVKKKVKYNTNLSATMPSPQLPGNTFLGWFTLPNGGTQVTKQKTTGASTLYAHWATTHPLGINPKLVNYLGKHLKTIQSDGFEFVNSGTAIINGSVYNYYTNDDITFYFRNDICCYVEAPMSNLYPNSSRAGHHINEYIKLYGKYNILIPGGSLDNGEIEFKFGSILSVVEVYDDVVPGSDKKWWGYISNLNSADAFAIWE